MTAPASNAGHVPSGPFEITALLGRGTRFEGKLYFEGSVRIDGAFHGTIKSDNTLVLGDGAEVFASVEVGTLIVRGGALYGNVRARDAIELFAPGKVVGDLHSPSISIERGVQFKGKCTMEPLDDLTIDRAVAPVTPANDDARLSESDLEDAPPTPRR
jgi:cytoskeletal protein CcmA (bactofilin family)